MNRDRQHARTSPFLHAQRIANGGFLVRRETPSKLVMARRVRQVKSHAREEEAADERKVEERRKAGTLGMSKFAITRREKREDRKLAAAERRRL
jgi:hypothetical protein